MPGSWIVSRSCEVNHRPAMVVLTRSSRPCEATPKDGSENSQNSASKSLRFWRI
jgi:hypothetical protein